jgi:hypothetical protein
MEIATSLSLIGAMVGEFTVAERGMGTLPQKAATDLKLALKRPSSSCLASGRKLFDPVSPPQNHLLRT